MLDSRLQNIYLASELMSDLISESLINFENMNHELQLEADCGG